MITGASHVVGTTTTVKFAEAGAADLSNEPRAALTVAETVERAGANALFVQEDVSRAQQAQTLIWQTNDRFGRLDVVAEDRTITARDNAQ